MSDFAFQKTKIEVVHTFKEADDADRAYYWSLTPQQRLEILEHLREINHADTIGSKFQRVFEFIEVPRR